MRRKDLAQQDEVVLPSRALGGEGTSLLSGQLTRHDTRAGRMPEQRKIKTVKALSESKATIS